MAVGPARLLMEPWANLSPEERTGALAAARDAGVQAWHDACEAARQLVATIPDVEAYHDYVCGRLVRRGWDRGHDRDDCPAVRDVDPRLAAFREGWLTEALRRLEDARTAGETVQPSAVEAVREALRALPLEGGQG